MTVRAASRDTTGPAPAPSRGSAALFPGPYLACRGHRGQSRAASPDTTGPAPACSRGSAALFPGLYLAYRDASSSLLLLPLDTTTTTSPAPACSRDPLFIFHQSPKGVETSRRAASFPHGRGLVRGRCTPRRDLARFAPAGAAWRGVGVQTCRLRGRWALVWGRSPASLVQILPSFLVATPGVSVPRGS